MGCVTSRKTLGSVTPEPILVKPAADYEASPTHVTAQESIANPQVQPPQRMRRISKQLTRTGTVFQVNAVSTPEGEERARPIHSLRGALVSRNKLTVRHRVSVTDPMEDPCIPRTSDAKTRPVSRAFSLKNSFAVCSIDEEGPQVCFDSSSDNPDFVIGRKFRDEKEFALPTSSLTIVPT